MQKMPIMVFRSGVPLVMMGLNLTRQALCFPEIVDRMEKVGTTASCFLDAERFWDMVEDCLGRYAKVGVK